MLYAFATVRDEVSGPWEATLSFDDPTESSNFEDIVGNIFEFVFDIGLDRVNGKMNQGLYATAQHVRQTRRLYQFEANEPTRFRDWARSANAIFFTGETLVNAVGEDLLDPHNQRSVPFHPAALARAERIRTQMRSAGIEVMTDFPPVRSEFESVLRAPAEVIERVTGAIAIAEISGCWAETSESIVDKVIGTIPHVQHAFTPLEREFIDDLDTPSDDLKFRAMQLSWSGQGALALGHLLGLISLPDNMVGRAAPKLDSLADGSYLPLLDLIVQHSLEELVARVPRAIDAVAAADFYEYVRSARWVAEDERVNTDRVPVTTDLDRSNLLEWHRALAWLHEPGADWEDVDTST